MEKDDFLDKLKRLVEVAKTKHNALDITEINDFFKGENLSPEKMEQIYMTLPLQMTVCFSTMMTSIWTTAS